MEYESTVLHFGILAFSSGTLACYLTYVQAYVHSVQNV